MRVKDLLFSVLIALLDHWKVREGAEMMAHRLVTKAGKELYGLRKQTVEPVFGIIKEVLGFQRFLLRGLEKVNLEWSLVSTSYNLKRLFNLGMRIKPA